MNQILLGDCLDKLKELPDNSVDSCVTDPPYGLGTREPTGEEIIAYLQGADLDHGGDFMGRDWDIPSVAVWKEVYRVLKPGGHLLSFGGTRTFDLISIGIRAAGFELRDTIAQQFGVQVLQWVQGCLDATSEILTASGWKLGTHVEVGELVATWDPASEQISLAPVSKVYKGTYTGDLVAFKNHNTDQLLTPNHRVYKKHALRKQIDHVRRKWFEEEWSVSEASEINRYQRIKLPLSGYHEGAGIGGTDYAALLGWVWAEGGFDNTGTGVRIYQSSVNQRYVDQIVSLLKGLCPTSSHYKRDRVYRGRAYTEHSWYFSGELAERVRLSIPDKHPTYELLWSMTLEEKAAFFDAAMCGDGTPEEKQFYQKDDGDREWFQTLCHMLGWQAMDNPSKYCVSVHSSSTTELHSKVLHAEHLVPYSGEVWCVGVPTGAFVARRNGKIFITGNSGFPKSASIQKYLIKQGLSAEEAAVFEGWGTALKPSWEPIIVARKPIAEKTVAKQVLKTGTGAINVDACRVKTASADLDEMKGRSGASSENAFPGAGEPGIWEPKVAGRWPANLLLTHSPECKIKGTKKVPAPVINRFDDGMKPFGDGAGHKFTSEQTGDADGKEEIAVYECQEGCPVAALDEQSGVLKSGGGDKGNKQGSMGYHGGIAFVSKDYESDTGGASRFFNQFSETPKAPFFYSPKVSKAERDRGLPKGTNKHPCLHPNALVMTDMGYKPISNIKIGDNVYSADGKFHCVEHVSRHPYQSDLLYSIVARNAHEPTLASDNHPFLIWRPQRKSGRILGGEVLWVRADQIQHGDYTMTPILASDFSVSSEQQDFWFVFGLYLAEGCLQKAGHGDNVYPSFSLHKNETHLVERITRVTSKEVSVYPKADSDGVQVIAFDPELGTKFLTLGGSGAATKALSPSIWSLPLTAREAIFNGWLAGDGGTVRLEAQGKTVSLRLASQLQVLGESLGYRCRVKQYSAPEGAGIGKRKFKSTQPYYQLNFSRPGSKREQTRVKKPSPHLVQYEGTSFSLRFVKRVDRIPYKGDVVNLSVEGSPTFQTVVGMSHNTVKPQALMRWLVKLVTPKGGTVLDPYCGSGSTGVAAVAEGFSFIGIERDPESHQVSVMRLQHAEPKPDALDMINEIEEA